jgi:glycosyltransferase involved in cell wall biosynthesis
VKKLKENKILIISYDIVGRKMAGPGIRYYEFAKELSDIGEIILAVPNECDLPTVNFKIKRYNHEDPESLKPIIVDVDVIIIQGYILYFFPFLKFFEGKVVVDLYNPFQFESLEMFSSRGIGERLRIATNNLATIKSQLQLGDFFICASEKQRDFWLGMLSSIGRINPRTYDHDRTLRKLIDIVPFGIQSEKPKHTKKVMKGVLENINLHDKVVLWGGGMWNWLDPITPIKAMVEICKRRKDINLVFLGVEHPDPRLPHMKKASEAVDLSKKMGLYNKNIFFNKWVSYEDRQNFLLESDIGISAHPPHIETRFSFRTRMLDYIWANLPIITTEGDWSGELVEKNHLGKVIYYNDYLGWARAIIDMIDNTTIYSNYKRNVYKQVNNYVWSNVVKPLKEYLKEPYHAYDKKYIFNLKSKSENEQIDILRDKLKDYSDILLFADKKEFLFYELNKEKDINFIPIKFIKDTEKREDFLKTEVNFHNLENEIKKSKRYQAVIIRNLIKPFSYQDLYSILSRILILLKEGGLIGIILPSSLYFNRLIPHPKYTDRIFEKYIFTTEMLLKNVGFKNLEKIELEYPTIWSKAWEDSFKNYSSKVEEILGEPRIIKLDRSDFKDIKLMSIFDILKYNLKRPSKKEIKAEKEFRKKDVSTEKEQDVKRRRGIKKYFDFIASLYFENIRRSYNETMKSINHNIHLQLNRETNEINSMLRDGLLALNNDFKNLIDDRLNSISEEIGIVVKILELMESEKISDKKIEKLSYKKIEELRKRMADISYELSVLKNLGMRESKCMLIFAKK